MKKEIELTEQQAFMLIAIAICGIKATLDAMKKYYKENIEKELKGE